MKKLLALLLAAACSLPLCVTSLAAAVPAGVLNDPLVGAIVDSDGDSAYGHGYDTLKPGSDYYYVIGPSSGSGYGILTDKDTVRVTLKKKANGKLVSDAEIVEKKLKTTRYVCIRFSIKDNFSSDEYKVEMEARIRARKALEYTTYPPVDGKDFFPSFALAGASRGPLLSPEDLEETYDQAGRDLAEAEKARDNLVKELRELVKEFTFGFPFSTADPKVAPPVKLDEFQKTVSDYEAQQALNQQQEQQKTLAETIASLEKEIQGLKDQTAALGAPGQSPDEAALQALKETRTQLQTKTNEFANALGGLGVDAEASINATLSSGKGITAIDGSTPAGDILISPNNAAGTLLPAYAAYNEAKADANTSAEDLAAKREAFNAALAGISAADGSPFAGMAGLAEDGSNTQAVGNSIWAVFKERVRQYALLKSQLADLQGRIAEQQAVIDGANGANASIDQQRATLQGRLDGLNRRLEDAKAKLAVSGANASARNATITEGQYHAAKAQIEAVNAYNAKVPDLVTAIQTVSDRKDGLTRAREAYLLGATTNNTLKSGDTYCHTFKFYIQNENREDDDATFYAGEKGVVIRPVKNERNTVTWENSDGPIAAMVFTADSEASYYCPRLSTRWSDADYFDCFHDVDAYLFDFVGNPRVPAATRPVLSLCNPFVDEDGRLTVRESRIHVYEVDSDGGLVDKTYLFDSGESDDGGLVLTTRTFTLGTYIVSDGKADLPERETASRPADPDIEKPAIEVNNNQKFIPNTGG